MMNLAETNFDDAINAFKAFLADNGMNQPLLWVFKEDVYSRRTDRHETEFWLKLPLPSSSEKYAKRHFELGKLRGFGVGLTAFAECEAGLCCSFVLPTDDEDAQYMLMSPDHLKMSYLSRDMPTAKVVRSRIKWSLFGLLPFRFRPEIHFVYLASRAEFSSNAA